MSGGGFSRIKDAALEKSLLLLLRPKFQRYGELRHIKLDTTRKCLAAELRLLGDPIPIEISQARYRVEQGSDGCRLTVYDVKLSKEWLQNLLEDRFPELTVPLPAYVAPLL